MLDPKKFYIYVGNRMVLLILLFLHLPEILRSYPQPRTALEVLTKYPFLSAFIFSNVDISPCIPGRKV